LLDFLQLFIVDAVEQSETAIRRKRDQQGDIMFLLDLSVEINKSNYKIFVKRI